MHRRNGIFPLAASISLGILLFHPAAVRAQGAASGPVTGQRALELSRAVASKWQADAGLFDFGTLSTAPLDAEGRSAEWYVKWSSKSAGKVNLMSVKNGVVQAFEAPSAGGRVIVLGPKSILDTKALLAMADAKGGAAHRAKGATVNAGLVQNPMAGPLWHLSYKAKDGKEVLHVAIEANGGKLKVLSP